MNIARITFIMPCLLAVGCAEQSEPIVRITVEYPGASTEDIDSTLAWTITSRLPCLKKIQSITSISSPGKVEIYAKGSKGTDPIKFTDQIRMVVDSVEEDLPADAEAATVQLLKDGAEIPDVRSQPKDEFQITLDVEKANALGVSHEQIPDMIRKALKDREVDREDVKVLGEIILTVDGKSIRLNDIAKIKVVQKPSHIVRKYPPATQP